MPVRELSNDIREAVVRETFQRLRNWLYPTPHDPTTALVLSGGGARSAFQAGVLRYIAEAFPDAEFPVLTGVSAGAINTAHLANDSNAFPEAAGRLVESWRMLEPENVVAASSSLSLLWGLLWRNGFADASDGTENPGTHDVRRTHGLLDTTPLWTFLNRRLGAANGTLTGVEDNLRSGHLQAVAVITTNYATGQTVTWVQGDDFDVWEAPDRVSVHSRLTVDHIMASTALPLVFPAVRIGDAWYGDGGIRLTAPLAPAVHLGADRVLAISNRYPRTRAEADEPSVTGYPPTAQIIGIVMNAIFGDALAQDAHTLARVNALVKELPKSKRHGMRPVDLLQIRPSVDLGRLAVDYQDRLPAAFRFLTTGLGTDETQSSDWLSVLLFDPDYIDRLLDIGYHDARRQHDELAEFLRGGAVDRGLHPPPRTPRQEETSEPVSSSSPDGVPSPAADDALPSSGAS